MAVFGESSAVTAAPGGSRRALRGLRRARVAQRRVAAAPGCPCRRRSVPARGHAGFGEAAERATIAV